MPFSINGIGTWVSGTRRPHVRLERPTVPAGAAAVELGPRARLDGAALGRGEAEGELLTQQIVDHPVVAAGLPKLRKEPWRRDELLR